MQVAGIQRCSLVDWPGKVAVALFTPGCNMDCAFCQNRALLGHCELYEAGSVLDWLSRRGGFTDGVVITGGEPTIQPGLRDFIVAVRRAGFPVKLDTNGARPDVLGQLLGEELLDYVAMDVKAPRERYREVCGVDVDQTAIDTSVCLIRGQQPAYEFRTTVLPSFTHKDVVSIARRVAGAQRYVLQQYRPVPGDPSSPHDAAWFREALEQIDGLVDTASTRGVQELAFEAIQVA